MGDTTNAACQAALEGLAGAQVGVPGGLYTRVDKKVVNGLPVWKDASGADRGSSPSMVLRGCVSLRHHLARPMAGSNS
jgi:hypothetical protein